MFDLRSLEHSTIIYESADGQGGSPVPLLRLAWNKQDPNYLVRAARRAWRPRPRGATATERSPLSSRAPLRPTLTFPTPPSPSRAAARAVRSWRCARSWRARLSSPLWPSVLVPQATITMDSNKVVVLDIRVPSLPAAKLEGHSQCVNALCAPAERPDPRARARSLVLRRAAIAPSMMTACDCCLY
eukprot:6358362-Prymnesium_polylepis.1